MGASTNILLKWLKPMLGVSLAIIGSVATLMGRRFNSPEQRKLQMHCYLWGAIFLCLGAVLERAMILTAFEVIVVIGCIIQFTQLTKRAAALLIFVAVIVVTATLILFSNWPIFTFASVGYLGLLAIALGFATNSNRWLLAGSGIMSFYSGTNALLLYSGLSAIFCLLNSIFFIITARQMQEGRHQ